MKTTNVEVERALLGALEMLTKIEKEEPFSAIEYCTRLQHYRDVLAAARPDLASDSYFSRAAFGKS